MPYGHLNFDLDLSFLKYAGPARQGVASAASTTNAQYSTRTPAAHTQLPALRATVVLSTPEVQA